MTDHCGEEELVKALTEIEHLGFHASASNRLVVRAGTIAHAALISYRSARKRAETPECTCRRSDFGMDIEGCPVHDDTKPPRGISAQETLLPCPFCGNEIYRSPRRHNPTAYCVTEGCYGKKMSVVNLDDPVWVAMWNTRAGIPAAQAIDEIDRLHETLKEAERFMTYFAGETGGTFVGPGTPQSCLQQIRATLAHSPSKFYGAECPSYPNCTGGCGLGCTHDVEAARASKATRG
jgi:hypothetical protein